MAAVQSGADAVYMGFGAYNARRSAKNFTDEEFAKAVRYCHLRGVRVFLTLNTLLTDRELSGGGGAAAHGLPPGGGRGAGAGLGGVALAREAAPDLPLHASTQMSLFTAGRRQRAAALGLRAGGAGPGAVPPGRVPPSAGTVRRRWRSSATALFVCATPVSAPSAPLSEDAAATGVPALSPAACPMGSMPRRREAIP